MGRKEKIKTPQALAGAVRQIVDAVRDEARKVHRNKQPGRAAGRRSGLGGSHVK